MPIYKTKGSIGSDLFSVSQYELRPFVPPIVYCGLAMEIPDKFVGVITGRSSLILKGILTHFGVIDNDYLLPIGVILVNLTKENYTVEKDHRIAKIAFLKCSRALFKEVMNFSESNLERIGGFGSTGI